MFSFTAFVIGAIILQVNNLREVSSSGVIDTTSFLNNTDLNTSSYTNLTNDINNAVISNIGLKAVVKVSQISVDNMKKFSDILLQNNKNVVTRTADQINQYVQFTNTSLNNWATLMKNNLASSSNNATYQNGSIEINQFVNDKINQLVQCSQNSFANVENQFNENRATLQSGFDQIQSAFSGIQHCIEIAGNNIIQALSCASNNRILVASLSASVISSDNYKFTALQQTAATVLLNPCFTETRVEIENGKRSLTQRLYNL